MKLPFAGALTKIAAMKMAAARRRQFMIDVEKSRITVKSKRVIDLEVISFSGTRDFPEQLLSLFSFVRFCGQPAKWHLYSDGTHTTDQQELVSKLFPFVTMRSWNENFLEKHKDIILPYSNFSPASKKIQVLAGHTYKTTTFFADSDILFGSRMELFLDQDLLRSGQWYLADVPVTAPAKSMYKFNFGFMVLQPGFDFEPAFEELKGLNGNYTYFSDQDAFGNAFFRQQATALDPRLFVLDTSDQFSFGDAYAPGDMALRHYVTPVRHKMWQRGWKWHLML